MDKKALLIIVLLGIVTGVAVACLMSEPFKENLYSFGVDYLGPNIVSGVSTVLTAPLAWGAQSITTAAITWSVIITIGMVGIFVVAKRLVWNKVKTKQIIPKVTLNKYQDQLSTPELYTEVKTQPTAQTAVKEEVKEAEPVAATPD